MRYKEILQGFFTQMSTSCHIKCDLKIGQRHTHIHTHTHTHKQTEIVKLEAPIKKKINNFFHDFFFNISLIMIIIFIRPICLQTHQQYKDTPSKSVKAYNTTAITNSKT